MSDNNSQTIEVHLTEYYRNLRLGGAAVKFKVLYEHGEFDIILPIKPPLSAYPDLKAELQTKLMAFTEGLREAIASGVEVPAPYDRRLEDDDQPPSST